MLITCPICSEVFVPSASIALVPCGHVFHNDCLKQWLGVKKNCPQCRQLTNERHIYRVYLNIADEDSAEDPSVLQKKVDDLSFKNMTLEKEMTETLTVMAEFNAKNFILNEKNKNLQSKLETKSSKIAIMETRLKGLKEFEEQNKNLRLERDSLRNELKAASDMRLVLHGSPSEADEALLSHCDGSDASRSLVTFCSALKKQMSSMEERVRLSKREIDRLKLEHRLDVQKLEQIHDDEKMALQFEREQLEGEIASLKKKMDKVTESLVTPNPKSAKDKALSRLLKESPMPEELRDIIVDDLDSSPDVVMLTSPESGNKQKKPRTVGLKPLVQKKTLSSSQGSSIAVPCRKFSTTFGAPKASERTLSTITNKSTPNIPKKLSTKSQMIDGSQLFASTRTSRFASGSDLQKRLYQASQAPSNGMVSNGLGATVHADHAILSKKKKYVAQ